MANLEPMPISSLPEGDIQDGDKAIIYRESTGKAYQTTGLAELSADLTDLDWRELGTLIPSGSDLDDYSTPGKYYITPNSTASTIEHTPQTNYSFTLIVMPINATARIVQIMISNYYVIYFRGYSSSGWGSWKQVSTTTISTSSVGDPVVMGEEENT